MADSEILHTALEHSKFKIEWSKVHFDGVKNLVEQVARDNVDVITVNNDAQPAIVTIGPNQVMPASLLMHLGDAIHNLNSVMDFLWSGLARASAPDKTSKVTFPRHETRQNLEAAAIKSRGTDAVIHKAFPDANLFILDSVQPCLGGNGESIWRLNKLDNINKHRMLLLAAYTISFDKDLVLVGSDHGRFTQSAGSAIQTQGHPLTIGLTPPVQIQDKPEATTTVIFSEPDHFTGEPILETLVNLTQATTEVVNLFEKTFL